MKIQRLSCCDWALLPYCFHISISSVKIFLIYYTAVSL